LTEVVRSFCQARDWDQFHNPKDLAIGLATESAELLAQFRFLNPAQVQERLESAEDRLAIQHEVGDALFFLLRFCERSGIDPARALHEKMAVNEARYPVDRSRGSNRKYDRL
jgi:NTP pyrophosphatase (non-canonical NTP hydrolase)